MMKKSKVSICEMRAIFMVALPMVVSNSSETILLFFDRLFLANYSEGAGEIFLDASLNGGLTAFTLSALFFFTCSFVNPLVAQYHGAGDRGKGAVVTTQAILFSIIGGCILIAFIPFLKWGFTALGHTEAQADLEFRYAQILIFGSVFNLIRNSLSGFFIGISKTSIVMVANVFCMTINIPLNYLLIFGVGIFPEWGIEGAATATIISHTLSILLLFLIYFSKKNNNEHLTRRNFRFDWRIFKKFIRFGLPTGLEGTVNLSIFNLFILLMSSYSETVGAATTVAITWDMTVFIPMLGVGYAVTSLSGKYIGAGKQEKVTDVLVVSMIITVVYGCVMILLFNVATQALIAPFAGKFADREGVYALAVPMIRLISFYILFDSLNIVFSGVLRGAGDTLWLMFATVTLHLLFGIGVFLCVKQWQVHPLTTWILFIVFVFFLGMTMVSRYLGGKWRSIGMIEEKN